ncbi:MAG: alpha/beta fold hydrolase [Sulfuricellaceae bacterium]|nr:alpha/beta fold hydrolase [Sulfuricellaceae bacterium]
MPSHRPCWGMGFAALFLALIFTGRAAFAETVEAKLPSGIVADASFHAGKAGMPALLLVHGFLQTRSAPPLSRLAETLSDAGYTVLSPTLSLGISRRSHSLACEAVHTHTLEGEASEISFWVDWLVRKHYPNIVLIGHSTGSKSILFYLQKTPNPAVRKAVLASLVPDNGTDIDREKAHRMLKAQAKGKEDLQRFSMGYCRNNYMSTPYAYLSYAVYDADRTLGLLDKAKVPVEIILGGADTLMEKGWPQKALKHGASITLIKSAGHFFDGPQEFDFADAVEAQLKSLRPARQP